MILLRRIGRQQAQENQSGGVLDAASGRAGKREERAVWTGLIPPCPGGERAARVARQPTVRGREWLQGQQPELHYCLLAINAVN